MADVLTKKQRSFNMSRIKGRNTSLELKMRNLIYKKGLRGYRLHPNFVGHPDLIFSKRKIAIFFDGCFWHKCPKCFIKPMTRKMFWKKKIGSNIKRDRVVNKQLQEMGWKVLRFWEHDIESNSENIVDRIAKSFAARNF